MRDLAQGRMFPQRCGIERRILLFVQSGLLEKHYCAAKMAQTHMF
jgi:hypothetical protein